MAYSSLSRKDNALKQLQNDLVFHIEEYHRYFENDTAEGHELGAAYIQGLFKKKQAGAIWSV